MIGFDHRDFINVVDELLKGAPTGTPSPAQIRTAANRAYYSAYGYLRHRIYEGPGDCFRGIGKHRPLIKVCLNAPNSAQLNSIGQSMKNLCDLRETADY